MKIHDIEQKTEAWYKLRRQYPLTASKAQAIGSNGKGLETLVWDVLAERYSNAEKEQISNKDFDRGNELEPNARTIYEMQMGYSVQEVGFVTNDKVSKVGGASPDGLVGKNGLVEIKCFDDTKHFKYIVLGLEPESQYVWQMQMQMLITEREWCDFVAYNPNYHDSLLIKRVEVNEEKQAKLKEGLIAGEKLIKEIEAKIK